MVSLSMDHAEPEIDRSVVANAKSPPPAPVPHESTAPTDRVLALQRRVGNQAVAELLSRTDAPVRALVRKGSTIPIKPAAKPVLDAWDVKLEPTPRPHQGKGMPRVIKPSLKEGQPKVFVGDTVIVRAHVKSLDDETYRSLNATIRLQGGVELADMEREGAEVLRWRLTFKAPGPSAADFDVPLGPAPIGNP
jgi:hypothetical protein